MKSCLQTHTRKKEEGKDRRKENAVEAGLILHCLGVCPITISIVNISIYFFNPHFTDEETEDCSKQLPNTTGLKFFFQR